MRLFTLEFEKPIVELEQTLEALQKQAEEQKIDLSTQIKSIEEKLDATKKEIFTNLTPWQRVQLARHPKRPYALDYLGSCGMCGLSRIVSTGEAPVTSERWRLMVSAERLLAAQP